MIPKSDGKLYSPVPIMVNLKSSHVLYLTVVDLPSLLIEEKIGNQRTKEDREDVLRMLREYISTTNNVILFAAQAGEVQNYNCLTLLSEAEDKLETKELQEQFRDQIIHCPIRCGKLNSTERRSKAITALFTDSEDKRPLNWGKKGWYV